MLDIMTNSRSAWDVNLQGDVCITGYARAYLYLDMEEDGDLCAFDNMVTGAPADVDSWFDATITFATDITDRDATGFGSICEYALKNTSSRGTTTTSTTAFLLTPVLP